jgi:hypothetical protein
MLINDIDSVNLVAQKRVDQIVGYCFVFFKVGRAATFQILRRFLNSSVCRWSQFFSQLDKSKISCLLSPDEKGIPHSFDYIGIIASAQGRIVAKTTNPARRTSLIVL